MNARLRFERAATDAAAKDASPLRRIPGLVVGAGSADGESCLNAGSIVLRVACDYDRRVIYL